MKKQNYTAPKMEQVKMESEMPVICASGAAKSVSATLQAVSNW